MADEVQAITATINTLVEDRKRQMEEARESGRTVNRLCRRIGKPAMFPEDEGDLKASAGLVIRRAQFVGVKFASAVREYLEQRGKDVHGPATADEIYSALREGGFQFETRDEKTELHRMRTSLGKNTTTFAKIDANGIDVYGLAEWYPELKKEAKPATGDDATPAPTTPPAANDVKPIKPEKPVKPVKGEKADKAKSEQPVEA